MRARDRDTFPVADRAGLYGCRWCGTYHLLAPGDKLACKLCRTAQPLIRVAQPDAVPASDTPARQSPNQATDR